MKHIVSLSILTALLMLCFACTKRGGSTSTYNIADYEPRYATGYSIMSAPDGQSSIITTNTPWQGATSDNAVSLFLQRNDEPPPSDFTGQVLRGGEARRIVCMSSTHVSMLDRLGAIDRVVGVSLPQYYTNPKLLARKDKIADVGYESNIDYETLVALRPDLVTLYGLSGANPMEGRLRELGIPFIYIGEYLEESPLGKAEWLVPMAELIGKRAEGEAIFKEIPQRYNHLKEVAATATSHPRVMINAPYGDSWIMASTRSYVGQLIADAGGEYVYTANDSGRSLPIDNEEAFTLTNNADVWINVSPITSLHEIAERYPRLAGTPSVANSQVWDTTLQQSPSGGNSYWEWGLLQPDDVLADLIMIFHPELDLNRRFAFYKRLDP